MKPVPVFQWALDPSTGQSNHLGLARATEIIEEIINEDEGRKKGHHYYGDP
jgi:hypothetical protein